MYRTLFALSGPAILAWLSLILLPKGRVTRRIAESAIFPAYLSILYVVGVVAAFQETGPGIMRDFGSADGVLKILRMESIALVAWIHILAFDQVVGLLIYRDNMRYRFVPLPVQSVILFATLMLGPVGFLSYWLARTLNGRAGLTAWGERDRTPLVEEPRPVALAGLTTARSIPALARDLLLRERALAGVAALGFALAGINSVVAAINGGWRIGAEGRLLEASKFDVAVGIFVVTQAMLLPLAGFTERRRSRWVWTVVAIVVYSFAIENVQAWRGLDPRFSQIAGAPDRLLGGVFFLAALVLMWKFIDLIATFFRRDALPDHPLLRNALRYATAATMIAFLVGIVMSFGNGRVVNGAGNLMPIHAAGFHAIQAIPIVGLLLGWSALPLATAQRILVGAAVGWTAIVAGFVANAASGQPPMSGTVGTALVIAGAVMWATSATFAWRARQAALHQPAVAAR